MYNLYTLCLDVKRNFAWTHIWHTHSQIQSESVCKNKKEECDYRAAYALKIYKSLISMEVMWTD